MDESTLLNNRSLWGEEENQFSAPELPLLTQEEQMFTGTEAATLGSQCSTGAGTYCVGRSMASIASGIIADLGR